MSPGAGSATASGRRRDGRTGARSATRPRRTGTASRASATTAATRDSSTSRRRRNRTTCRPRRPPPRPPPPPAAIGSPDQANHQYDLADLWAAAEDGHLPAVSFIKAAGADQGGGGASDPLDEQAFVVDLVNRLQQLPTWPETALILLYDDSDGSYDHVPPPLVNSSRTAADSLTGPGTCGGPAPPTAGYQGRCGYGPRLPFIVISSWSRVNHVDHTRTDQTSVIRFIEDNWQLGRIGDGSFDVLAGPLAGMFDFSRRHDSRLILDPDTGLPLPASGAAAPVLHLDR